MRAHYKKLHMISKDWILPKTTVYHWGNFIYLSLEG